jgi:hypothetical protein
MKPRLTALARPRSNLKTDRSMRKSDMFTTMNILLFLRFRGKTGGNYTTKTNRFKP